MEVSCDVGLKPPADLSTKCPDAKWLNSMILADPNPGKVFVDIGCNKGQDLVGFMEMWDSSEEQFWSTKKWTAQYAETTRGQKLTYVCGAAPPESTTPSKGKQYSHLKNTGVCVEGGIDNVRMLNQTQGALGYGKAEYGQMHVIHAAVSSQAAEGEMVEFEDSHAPGGERGHIKFAVDKTDDKTPTPLMTVDMIVKKLGLEKVDVLTIDTEGHDPAVIEGASKTLESVRYLQFEIHRDLKGKPWSKTKLKDVVAKLDQKGFDCYWAGSNGKLLSMNHCWTDHMDMQKKKAWGNAACVKRDDVWANSLKAFAK